MSASLAILTIGIVPMQEVLPLLTEYIDEDNISHHVSTWFVLFILQDENKHNNKIK